MLLEIFVKCLENLKLSNTILILDKFYDVYLHFHYYFWRYLTHLRFIMVSLVADFIQTSVSFPSFVSAFRYRARSCRLLRLCFSSFIIWILCQ